MFRNAAIDTNIDGRAIFVVPYLISAIVTYFKV